MAKNYNSNPKRMPKKTQKRKGRNRIGRTILILLEVLMVAILSIGCYAVNLLGNMQETNFKEESIYVYGQNSNQTLDIEPLGTLASTTKADTKEEPESEDWVIETQYIEMDDEYDVLAHQETLNGYWNILVLGVDARLNQPLATGEYRSDVIIICSINVQTKHIKLASVYRDTLLWMQSGKKFIKVNDGVFRPLGGSPEEMLSIINMNLDLNIKDIVIVNWAVVAEAVNILGGLDLVITEEELANQWINGYLTEVVEETGIATNGPVVTSGLQRCDGAKVVAYCRNRKGSVGSDFGRTQRQREVIEKMLEKAKIAGFGTLIKLVSSVSNNMLTTLTMDELLSLAQDINSYTIGETTGFPSTNRAISYVGQYNVQDPVMPITLKSNVKELHTFLFGDDGYQPSTSVQQISDNIDYLLGTQ